MPLSPEPSKAIPAAPLASEKSDPTSPTAWGGKLNIYTCDRCRSHIVTRDVAEGVTPFMLPSHKFCPKKCGARDDRVVMTSSFYRVWDQRMREDYQWYRPAEGEAYDPAYRDHVEKGGLIIRPFVEPDPLEATRLQLEANVNRFLANAAKDAGFEVAHSDIPGTVAELAPGWDYIDMTPHGAIAPVITLTSYSTGPL